MEHGKVVGSIQQQLKTFSLTPLAAAVIYLVLIGLAEVVTTFVDPALGLIFHGFILVALLVHTARTWNQPEYRFLLPLTLGPLIRLLSLSLPLYSFPIISWYFIISVPIF